LSSEQHSALLKSNISAYFADSQVHNFRRRPDLGPDVNMSISNWAKQPKVWTDKPIDLGRKASLQRELAEARGEMEEATNGITQCKEEVRQAQEQINKLRKEVEEFRKAKSKAQMKLTEWRALPQRIEDEERKLADVQLWLNTARDRRDDWEQKKQEVLIDRAEEAVRYAGSVRALKEAMESAIEAEVKLIEAVSDYEVLSELNQNIKDTLAEKKDEEREAAKNAKDASKVCSALVKKARSIGEEATKEQENGRPQFLAFIQAMIDQKWTPADWEAELETVNANIALTEGGSGDAIRQYEERTKKIAVLEERLGTINEQVAEHRSCIQEVRSIWEPQLDALTARISDAFADYFARIGCAGQVEVHKANSAAADDCTEENGGDENGLDFASWALHISVKFRENEPLSILDDHRQSGGERAVSTIFYLMALQRLSRAPFRVVDEINQGMDNRNERMMHGRMVDIATATRADGGNGSQYFLITPKLLTGLDYKRGMTVLCIVSGEQVPGEGEKTTEEDAERIKWKRYPRLDFAALAARARSLDLARLGTGQGLRRTARVDSGVAMAAAG
jgi:structural maintenance of chromosomes protein 5